MKYLMMMSLVILASSLSHAAKDLELNCSVVSVGEANNYVLEEGLGSIYDIDEDGNVNADGDSTSASILIKKGKIELDLGQGSWNNQSSKMKVSTFKYDIDYSSEQEGVEIKLNDYSGVQTWRIFPSIKMAIINYTGDRYQNTHLATLDCSGVVDVRFR